MGSPFLNNIKKSHKFIIKNYFQKILFLGADYNSDSSVVAWSLSTSSILATFRIACPAFRHCMQIRTPCECRCRKLQTRNGTTSSERSSGPNNSSQSSTLPATRCYGYQNRTSCTKPNRCSWSFGPSERTQRSFLDNYKHLDKYKHVARFKIVSSSYFFPYH